MTQFRLSTSSTCTKKVRRKAIAYLVRFEYPEAQADQMPLPQKCELDSQPVLSFYDVPAVGDEFPWAGAIWKVARRLHHPYKPYSRGTKKVSELSAEFVQFHAAEEPTLRKDESAES